MGCSNPAYKDFIKKVIWIDENIYDKENKEYMEKLKKKFKLFSGYTSLEEGFKNFYSNDFILIVTIVSGKFWGRYFSLLKEKINQILNIPYTIIFTSENYKEILLQKKKDIQLSLSYDTLIGVNDPFFNPGGIVSCFDDLVTKIEYLELISSYHIKPRIVNKYEYEGLLTFEYLQNEEDLIVPTLYKDIITKEPLEKEEVKRLINYLLSFENNDLR